MIGWSFMALSVALVALSAWQAIPYRASTAVIFPLIPLPGLAAAVLADRRRVRWPLVVLGAFYAVGWVVLFMLYFTYVGLLWILAALTFPGGRRQPAA